MAAETKGESNSLELDGVIGFNGQVQAGLLLHPDDEHLIYPLGSTIVVKNLLKNTQVFLQKDGHDTSVSALAISRSGKYLASGQETHMGFPATVIIWNLETCEVHKKLDMHKGKVESLSFSPNEKYVTTLGGQDDNRVIVWDVETGEAVCGSKASNELATIVMYLNNNNETFVTAGDYNLRIWTFDLQNRKIRPADCILGQLKRKILCLTIDDKDEFLYAGTGTGDVLQINLEHNVFKLLGPAKKGLTLGVRAIARTKKGNIIAGAGDGAVAVLSKDSLKILKQMKVSGDVSSLQLNAKGDHFFVGTGTCSIYLVQLSTFAFELRNTCHSSRINDVAFPANYSELFATCSASDIRIWHAANRNELLRIQVPNLMCNYVCFSHDGKSIVSGWNDGKIRAFMPQSGKLKFVINDAHLGGVTAVTGTSDSRYVLSGGNDGQVRVWEIGRHSQRLLASMKEHTTTVSCIEVNHDDTEALSSSADGSCIVWSLERFVRNTAIFASTQFRSIAYHPDESQILTCGTDRKITYWDAVDASPIRIMDSSNNEINSVSIASDGESFVSGGADKLIKVWGYDDGLCYAVGVGHSGSITKVKVSPDQKFVVSVGAEGAIFLWNMPVITGSADQVGPQP